MIKPSPETWQEAVLASAFSFALLPIMGALLWIFSTLFC